MRTSSRWQTTGEGWGGAAIITGLALAIVASIWGCGQQNMVLPTGVETGQPTQNASGATAQEGFAPGAALDNNGQVLRGADDFAASGLDIANFNSAGASGIGSGLFLVTACSEGNHLKCNAAGQICLCPNQPTPVFFMAPPIVGCLFEADTAFLCNDPTCPALGYDAGTYVSGAAPNGCSCTGTRQHKAGRCRDMPVCGEFARPNANWTACECTPAGFELIAGSNPPSCRSTNSVEATEGTECAGFGAGFICTTICDGQVYGGPGSYGCPGSRSCCATGYAPPAGGGDNGGGGGGGGDNGGGGGGGGVGAIILRAVLCNGVSGLVSPSAVCTQL